MATAILRYRGYIGEFRYDADLGVYHVHVTGTRDAITFEAAERGDVEKAFQESVDDYLAFCREPEAAQTELPVSRQSGGLRPGINLDCHTDLLDTMEQQED